MTERKEATPISDRTEAADGKAGEGGLRLSPREIEAKSFELIRRELGDRRLDPENAPVILRVIHATADFDFADNLFFSPGAVRLGREALLGGCDIVTDTRMAMAGVSRASLSALGGRLHCFMSDPSVAEEARTRGVTRAAVSMERAAALDRPCIFALGNAPTALLRLCELMEEGRVSPALVIGVPVGFVNVVESKERVLRSGAPCIVARGRKGGSGVAAAICNALLYGIRREEV